MSSEGDPTAGPNDDALRQRAYEISQRPDAGTPEENPDRALRELREEPATEPSAGTTAQDAPAVSPFPPFTSATTHP